MPYVLGSCRAEFEEQLILKFFSMIKISLIDSLNSEANMSVVISYLNRPLKSIYFYGDSLHNYICRAKHAAR